MIATLTARFGHRGVWLMVMGTIWLVFGLGALFGATGGSDRAWVAHDHIPDQAQAAAWLITGATAIYVGHHGRGRDDWLGHVALYLIPAAWAASFTAAYAVWVATTILAAIGWVNHTAGYERGWYGALIWAVIVAMIRLVSSWANPSPALIPTPAREEQHVE